MFERILAGFNSVAIGLKLQLVLSELPLAQVSGPWPLARLLADIDRLGERERQTGRLRAQLIRQVGKTTAGSPHPGYAVRP